MVPGNGPAVLGMSEIGKMDALTVPCNTRDMQVSSKQIRREQTDE